MLKISMMRKLISQEKKEVNEVQEVKKVHKVQGVREVKEVKEAKGDEGGGVKTAMLKFSSVYPLYSCGAAAAEVRKYSFDIGQIKQPNHPKFEKAGHFQVNF